MQHAAVVGDLVEGQQQEAHVHALHNGAQASHGSAHACRCISWRVTWDELAAAAARVDRQLRAA